MAKIRLSATLQDAAGPLGSYVVAVGRSGLVLRQKPRYRRHQTPAMQAAADRMRRAAELYATLTEEQVDAWRAYAESQVRHNEVNGHAYTMTGNTAFIQLTTKMMQAVPTATVPLWPPTGVFTGDVISVTVGAGPAGSGTAIFTASGPNAAGVLTELMVQKLASRTRKPSTRFTSAGFVGFTPGHLTQTVALEKGFYACAFRFVEASTGRSTPPIPCEKVEVV